VAGLIVTAAVRHGPSRDPASPSVPAPAIDETVHRHPRLRAMLRSRADPSATTGLALTVAILILLTASTMIGVLAAMARSNAGLARFDPRIAAWAADHVTASSTPALSFISQFGGALVVIPIAIVVAAIESLRMRSRAVWAFLLLVVGGQFLLANSVKFFVDRARPTIDQLSGFSGTSFPSGHATAAAATYAALALLVGSRRSINTRAIAAGAAVAIAIVVGGTRVLLGVHWLTDVVAGLVLGWAWFAVCSLAFGGRGLRFGAPVKTAQRAAAEFPTRVATRSHPR